jgi:hypothetical protein
VYHAVHEGKLDAAVDAARERLRMSEQNAAPTIHTRNGDAGSEGTGNLRATDNVGAPRGRDREENLPGTETKAAFKTTELIVYVLAVLGVLIASAIVDNSFGADPAWRYVTYLTVGYMISRGLAKSGSRNPRAEGE